MPAVQNFVITIPIEKRGGAFRYRATVDLPPIAGGAGSLVHLDASVGKRYRLGGKQRSYVAARCGDGVLRTHGRFTFGDGTIIDGSVEKGCTVPLRSPPSYTCRPRAVSSVGRAGDS